jgi:hypothetical protein
VAEASRRSVVRFDHARSSCVAISHISDISVTTEFTEPGSALKISRITVVQSLIGTLSLA